ncbi:MAG: amidohydrolase family protein [Chitinophagaceae bacterium]|nr:amidohydrolase family protein [Chitinophagaceae bacterium]
MRKIKLLAGGFLLLLGAMKMQAQTTFPVNGVADKREGSYAFTNATIVKDGQTTLSNATLVIRDGKIVAIGTGIAVPKEAIVIDCKDKYIYPSFIDIYADYGIATPQRQGGGGGFGGPQQLNSNQKGAYGWNQALRTDIDGARLFAVDDPKAKVLRDQGFGTVLSHQKDGIARGTGVVVTLANEKENLVIVKEKASAHYSFSKGVSPQSYPASMIGSVALLRQTHIDGQWYKNNPAAEGVNLTMKYWTEQQSLPQIFDAGDKWAAIRADRIGDEFGVQYIIKGGLNEYQRINEIAATKASFIISLNYPQAMDVDDPNDARFVSLADMKHWELAPSNPSALEKANIQFCLTTADLRDPKQFTANLRKAIEAGLTEGRALESLTKTPANLLGVYDKVGSLETGKLANFIITSAPVFSDKAAILQNWIQGQKYSVKEDAWTAIAGTYSLELKAPGQSQKSFKLDVKANNAASVIGKDTVAGKFSFDGKMVKLSFAESKRSRNTIRLSGVSNGDVWQGTGEDSAGTKYLWVARFEKAGVAKADSARKREPSKPGKLTYPMSAYGWEELPKQETLLIKNATVWTSEQDGKIEGADVLVKNGKIAQVGKNLSDAGAKVVDGTGKHLTAGIIDEHSHIAAFSINEGGQSVTSEVRMGDNLNPDDVNIYRQLSGGVTTSHILHGSANTIGGQTQLIKLRWGVNDEALKFQGWTGFIKFALGENVKRSSSTQGNTRFPDSRMGVEQVLTDAFQRATDYQNAIKKATDEGKAKKAAAGSQWNSVRRDLELDALVEIMNKQRFITCHSYVQTEITYMMRVAEKYGFTVNTFTHILEGYKVADKMKAHGAAASTFADWWAYKMEVLDAIPQGPALMQRVGVNVAINSDDAEMARRLNQEAAKSIKYAGMSEEDAWKMVTINPATMLHVQDKVGSIKAGKDADLVLWSDNPLSIYAVAEKTIVDGIVYFDRERDLQLRKRTADEKNRIIQKMIGEKRAGLPTQAAQPSMEIMHTCSDHQHSHGLLIVDADDINGNK